MPDRIKLSDPALFPVQAFFNAISDDSFIRVVDSLTKGIGYSVNDCDCSFVDDLDPEEETFEGVRFSHYKQSVVISSTELRQYVAVACNSFTQTHPELKELIDTLVAR